MPWFPLVKEQILWTVVEEPSIFAFVLVCKFDFRHYFNLVFLTYPHHCGIKRCGSLSQEENGLIYTILEIFSLIVQGLEENTEKIHSYGSKRNFAAKVPWWEDKRPPTRGVLTAPSSAHQPSALTAASLLCKSITFLILATDVPAQDSNPILEQNGHQ